MTRNEAIAAGLSLYTTGKPCKHGHDAPRYTSCGVCTLCLRQSADGRARLRNTIIATRGKDAALFAYKLHPDDHAAALAFCQALDMQRARTPQAASALALPPRQPDAPVPLPPWLEAARSVATVPPEVEAQHEAHRRPTNGS